MYVAEYNPDHDGGIYTAADAWCEDPTAAKVKYGPIASWDLSEVTDLTSLFIEKPAFNEDMSRWEVGQAKSMEGMFWGAQSFSGEISGWDVGQVESTKYMFYGATSFNGDLSRWEVGQVRSMASMFQGATLFDGDRRSGTSSPWPLCSVAPPRSTGTSRVGRSGRSRTWAVCSRVPPRSPASSTGYGPPARRRIRATCSQGAARAQSRDRLGQGSRSCGARGDPLAVVLRSAELGHGGRGTEASALSWTVT